MVNCNVIHVLILSVSRVKVTFYELGSGREDGNRNLTLGLWGTHLPGPGLQLLSDTLHRNRWCSQLGPCQCPRTPRVLLSSHLQASFLDNTPASSFWGHQHLPRAGHACRGRYMIKPQLNAWKLAQTYSIN